MVNTAEAASVSSTVTVTTDHPPQANVEDVLSAILESPNFTVAEYLNTALYDVIEPKEEDVRVGSTTTNRTTNTAPLVIHRLTELAVALQMQTQTSHDTIHRTGMELQTILPRCLNDMQRLQTSYTNLWNDCHHLHEECCQVTNRSSGSAAGSGSAGTVTAGSAGTNEKVATSSSTTTATATTTTTPTTTTIPSTTTTTTTTSASTTNSTTGSGMDTVSAGLDTTSTNAAAAAAMETLGTLHALQTYLHRTKEILIALDVWDTTINAISNFMVQENTSDAVQCLISLQQSERTLRGMTEQATQRKLTLEKLQQQVTTLLLQPNLEHALSLLPQYQTPTTSGRTELPSTPSSSLLLSADPIVAMPTTLTTATTASANTATVNTAPIQQCVQLYRQLNQFHTLIVQYIKQRPGPMHQFWFEYSNQLPMIPPSRHTSENMTDGAVDTRATIMGGEPQQHPMVQWLPNYYQQVLNFMNEERRLCEQIFQNSHHSTHSSSGTSSATVGTATATSAITIPTILIQIVQECFRTNITSSFTSRLHTIYNPNTAVTTTSSMSSSLSFPIIATLYESTIQFLSLLYESVVSSYMDLMESTSASVSTTTNGNDVWQLYQQICITFMSIVLPFREYQGKHYHAIELQYVQLTIQPNIKAIQQLTKHMKSNTDMTVEVLQQTMDQLQSVATKTIFTVLESTLQRYELLNGGYYIVDMIQMMDTNVLNQYMNEISISVHTISAYIVQNESSHFVKVFEEEHVSIALQILLLMNQLIQSVQQIEYETLIMIQRLYDRIRNYQNQEERRRMSTTMSFQLSETLSMVEVNTILTTHVAIRDEQSDDCNSEFMLSDAITTLQRLSDNAKTPLFATVHETIQHKLLLSCHTFVFDVCYAIPRYYLSSIMSYKSWKADASAAAINEYGTLPQEYMTHIGEHMLALVQALEPFAMNAAYLQQINQNGTILMNPKLIRRVVQPIWIDVVSAMGSKNGVEGNETTLQILMNGTELIDYVLGDVASIQHDDLDPNQEEDEDVNHKAVTTFCNTWLDVISTAMTGRLIERILRIPLLTNQGCEHIQADLAYIMNVLTALGIPGHPHPLLSHIATLATLDETVLKERQDSMSSTYNNPETTLSMRLIQSIEQRFIAMRSFG